MLTTIFLYTSNLCTTLLLVFGIACVSSQCEPIMKLRADTCNASRAQIEQIVWRGAHHHRHSGLRQSCPLCKIC